MKRHTKTTDAPDLTPEEQEKAAAGTKKDRNEQEIRITKESTDRYQPPRGGMILVQVLLVIFFAVFVSRFWYLQLHMGAEFARQAQDNRWRQERISAPRGRIFDARGRILADNRTAYGLSVVRDDIKDLPATLAQISAWTNVPVDQLKERYRQGKVKVKPFEPMLLVPDLPFELMARIESELHDWPGLEIVVRTKRTYPQGELFTHLLGYVAEANEKELEKDKDLAMGDLVGKAGIEYSLDKRLRGSKGLYDIEVDASGRMLGQYLREEPKSGEELKLTIDIDIQNACAAALGKNAGSVIVMEPDTGKIRALVTMPSYDNNLFAAGISKKDWEALRTNERFPLQNRAIQSTYPPGSIWKLVMSACLLESGIPSSASVFCAGHTKLGNQLFHCWKHSGHGSQNMEMSLVNSCDVYYYLMAERIGIDRIEQFAKQCGFGKPTGIDLPHEKSGLVPSKEWKRRRYRKAWSRGETFNASIGQGYVLTTPIQNAVYLSAVLNGGSILKPQLVENDPKEVRGHIPASPETLKFVIAGMRHTASTGTARVVHRNDADMGGKTGTAQVVRLRGHVRASEMAWKERDHAWISTWGRKNGKTYVVLVMVEHGGGGSSTAGPVARQVYNFLFSNSIYTAGAVEQPPKPLPGPPIPAQLQKQRDAARNHQD